MFKFADGDLLGIVTSENNMVVEWLGKGRVLFSFAQRGNAISAHFASDKAGLRHLKEAIEDFCAWSFDTFEWCTMVLAVIKKQSVMRLVKKCGFNHVTNYEDNFIFARPR